MSFMFSATKICEKALRKIGAFSINDSAANGDELIEALEDLDLLVAEQAGSTTCFWLIPATLSVPLTGGTGTYDIMATLGANAPTDGIQFPVSATVKDSAGEETPLRIVTRTEYEELSKKTTSGTPDSIWIDRLDPPTMKTYPVLGTAITGYTIELVVQTFAETYAGTRGTALTGLRPAWQRWAIEALAASIGSGSVRRLPDREIKMFQAEAEKIKKELNAFENRQHANTSQRIAYRDF